MVNRAVWFVAGAGAGVYAVRRAKRAVEVFTPEGLADRMAGWSLGAHLFGQEVRAGMEEKETELRRRMGLALDGREPSPASGRHTLDRPEAGRDHGTTKQIGKGSD